MSPSFIYEVIWLNTISIDIETYSSVNLAKAGVYKYAEAEDFEILLFAYSVDGGEVVVVDVANGESIPIDIIKALVDTSITKWAFNAQFERVCLSRYLRDMGELTSPKASSAIYLNPKSWIRMKTSSWDLDLRRMDLN